MTAKVNKKPRQYVIVIEPQKFDTADIMCFTVSKSSYDFLNKFYNRQVNVSIPLYNLKSDRLILSVLYVAFLPSSPGQV